MYRLFGLSEGGDGGAIDVLVGVFSSPEFGP